MSDARRLSGAALVLALQDARKRTLAWAGDLSDAQWQVPQQEGINPLAWELAHIAWFAEFWVLRGPHIVDANGAPRAAQPPVHAGPDALLDSALLPHAQRWQAPLPQRAEVLRMLAAQLDACTAALPLSHEGDDGADDSALYFHRLVLFHEDMHGEALAWLRAALGYPAPRGVNLPSLGAAATLAVRGGSVHIGATAAARGFVFDNEQHGLDLDLADFEIDARPISAGEYLRFVESGGYDEPTYWGGPAAAWRRRGCINGRRRHRRRGAVRLAAHRATHRAGVQPQNARRDRKREYSGEQQIEREFAGQRGRDRIDRLSHRVSAETTVPRPGRLPSEANSKRTVASVMKALRKQARPELDGHVRLPQSEEPVARPRRPDGMAFALGSRLTLDRLIDRCILAGGYRRDRTNHFLERLPWPKKLPQNSVRRSCSGRNGFSIQDRTFWE